MPKVIIVKLNIFRQDFNLFKCVLFITSKYFPTSYYKETNITFPKRNKHEYLFRYTFFIAKPNYLFSIVYRKKNYNS